MTAGRLLVLNAGSSSLKWQLFGLQPFAASIGGLVDRIGDTSKSTLSAKTLGAATQQERWKEQVPIQDHVSGLQMVLDFLRNTVSKTIGQEVAAVGHRVVHGLHLHKATLLDESALATIRKAVILAPLHNPAGLQGIAAAQQLFQGVPQVGVFDTAFHQTMPAMAYTYGLPHELCDEHMIRRYGFHGTSHKYLAEQAAQRLGKPLSELNAITCHLGNGSSVTAIKNGMSVDTSMGLTPLEGLLMGTRSGDIDAAVPLHLITALGMSAKDVGTMLNKKSGLLGVCGQSDLRSVIELADEGDERSKLALSMFAYRVRKYIGAYTAALGGRVDAVVFSAGVGENSSIIRGLICEGLQGLGMELDPARNDAAVGGASGDISSGASRVRMLVIPTDEELSIAQQTLEVVHGLQQEGNKVTWESKQGELRQDSLP